MLMLKLFFFFFKPKTANQIRPRLVGLEMGIRNRISSCIASTVISDMKYFKCECKKVEDAKFCQQVVAKKGTFKNVEMYAAAVAYHCEKMSRL